MTPSDDEPGGMSTPMKVAAGAAVGLATAAAVGVGKKLISSDDEGQNGANDAAEESRRSRPAGQRGSTAAGRSASTAKQATSTRRKSPAARKTSSSGTGTRSAQKAGAERNKSAAGKAKTVTKERLYNQAKRLKIEGRSSMTREQLERAVERAKSKSKSPS